MLARQWWPVGLHIRPPFSWISTTDRKQAHFRFLWALTNFLAKLLDSATKVLIRIGCITVGYPVETTVSVCSSYHIYHGSLAVTHQQIYAQRCPLVHNIPVMKRVSKKYELGIIGWPHTAARFI